MKPCPSIAVAGASALFLLAASSVSAWIGPFSSSASSRAAPPPIVICPGFGNDQIDYLNPMNLGEEAGMVQALRRRGFPVYVVPVKRTDWLKFASGLATPSFWSQTMTPRNPSFAWYLDKVIDTVEIAVSETEGRKALLVGHSAGGWLARAALGDGTWAGAAAEEASELVRGCVTLGSPHLPPAPPGVDMTRGALVHVHVNYPGAFLKNKGISYLTVAGVAVEGKKDERKRAERKAAIKEGGGREGGRERVEDFAWRSYVQVCGRGDVVGDGVVPLEAAHLEGAKQINLKDVFHSINAPRAWYGSEEVIDSWLRQVEGVRY